MIKAIYGMLDDLSTLPLQVQPMYNKLFDEKAKESTAIFSFKEWEELEWKWQWY